VRDALVQVLLPAILAWLCYRLILKKNAWYLEDDSEGVLSWLWLWFKRILFALFLSFSMLLTLLVPLGLFVFNLPQIVDLARRGLSPQDLHVASLSSPRLEPWPASIRDEVLATEDDLNHPEWQKVRALVRERLGEQRLGSDTWRAVIAWGRELAWRADPLRSVNDTQAARLALARLRGTDDLPERAAPVLRGLGGNRAISRLFFFHAFYPNEEVALVWFTTSPVYDRTAPLLAPLALLLAALLILRGFRTLTLSLLGFLLWLRRDPVFETLRTEAFSRWRFLATTLLLTLLGWISSQQSVEPFYVLFATHPENLIGAILWNVLVGGMLVESLGNVLAVLLIRLGVNPLRIVWDNVLIVLLSVLILWFFQNGWLTILSAVAIGTVQIVGQKLMARWRLRKGNARK
jgi:hypothetical protein